MVSLFMLIYWCGIFRHSAVIYQRDWCKLSVPILKKNIDNKNLIYIQKIIQLSEITVYSKIEASYWENNIQWSPGNWKVRRTSDLSEALLPCDYFHYFCGKKLVLIISTFSEYSIKKPSSNTIFSLNFTLFYSFQQHILTTSHNMATKPQLSFQNRDHHHFSFFFLL